MTMAHSVHASRTLPRLVALSLLFLFPFPTALAADESMVYPGPHPEAYRTLSLGVSLIGVSVLSFCVARRTAGFRAGASPSRRLLVAILIDSWVFIFSAALMTSGIGLSLNSTVCSGAIFLCIVFYALSKVLIYMFLAERVYTLHAGADRLQSTAYRICLVFLLGFGVVVSLMTWGRIAFLRDGTTHTFPFTEHIMNGGDNACVIGLIRPASLSLLVYDLFLNFLFTTLFLYPLYRAHNLTVPLRRLARRTLCAALVALVTSVANIAILTALHGQELGWVCLGSCGSDVTINALALFFVTGSYDDPPPQKPFDTVSAPVTRRRSAMPNSQTRSARQPEAVSHRSVHFDIVQADQSMTMDFEMCDKTNAGNASRTGTSYLSTTFGTVNDGTEKPKHQDSYISPNGMVTSGGVIGSEKGKSRRKRPIDLDLADVADIEMPKCSTPDGEETRVYVRSEGRPPRGRPGSRSHSRANSWSRRASTNLEADIRTETPGQPPAAAGGGVVSKFMSIFRTTDNNNNDEAQTASMIVSIQTMREEHVDPVQDPRLDPDLRRWRNLKHASAAGPEDLLEAGL